jgi:hypothetical protein
LVELFNLDMESNIPSFFQVSLIFFSAFFIFFILKSGEIKVKNLRHFWIVLFILTVYMGIDEASQIHEKFGNITNKIFNNQPSGYFHFSWVIIGGLLALPLVIYFTIFIIKINKRLRYLFIIAAILFLGGSLLVEIFSGFFIDRFGVNFTYQLLVILEESMEMFGIAFFIKALIKYIKFELKTEELNLGLKFS